jgi:thioredoxin-related protein
MKLIHKLQILKFFSRSMIFTAMFIVSLPATTRAADLIMFEQVGCVWCEAFNREIAPIYPKTAEGQRAPLRRVDIDQTVPQDLAFIAVERLAPLFVLVDKGREIGRIRGYPGEDHFWGLLGVLIKKLDGVGTSGERTKLDGKSLRVAG